MVRGIGSALPHEPQNALPVGLVAEQCGQMITSALVMKFPRKISPIRPASFLWASYPMARSMPKILGYADSVPGGLTFRIHREDQHSEGAAKLDDPESRAIERQALRDRLNANQRIQSLIRQRGVAEALGSVDDIGFAVSGFEEVVAAAADKRVATGVSDERDALVEHGSVDFVVADVGLDAFEIGQDVDLAVAVTVVGDVVEGDVDEGDVDEGDVDEGDVDANRAAAGQGQQVRSAATAEGFAGGVGAAGVGREDVVTTFAEDGAVAVECAEVVVTRSAIDSIGVGLIGCASTGNGIVAGIAGDGIVAVVAIDGIISTAAGDSRITSLLSVPVTWSVLLAACAKSPARKIRFSMDWINMCPCNDGEPPWFLSFLSVEMAGRENSFIGKRRRAQGLRRRELARTEAVTANRLGG
jgi:hypothetical protein